MTGSNILLGRNNGRVNQPVGKEIVTGLTNLLGRK
jgi:hypothetical protein